MLFEIRIVNGQWCLDSFATAGGQSRTLLNCQKLHPFGPWYRVTAVYDGKMLHNYVGEELQGEGELNLPEERPAAPPSARASTCATTTRARCTRPASRAKPST
jgi:hypothetical protein